MVCECVCMSVNVCMRVCPNRTLPTARVSASHKPSSPLHSREISPNISGCCETADGPVQFQLGVGVKRGEGERETGCCLSILHTITKATNIRFSDSEKQTPPPSQFCILFSQVNEEHNLELAQKS